MCNLGQTNPSPPPSLPPSSSSSTTTTTTSTFEPIPHYRPPAGGRGRVVLEEHRVVAEFLQRADGRENVGLLPLANVADFLGREEVLVDLLLERGEAAADNLNQLRGKVLSVQSVRPAENKLIDQGGHVVLAALRLEDFRVGGVGLPSSQDVTDHLPSEIGGGAQNAWKEGGREGGRVTAIRKKDSKGGR